MTLVEATGKKCTFLAEVVKQLGSEERPRSQSRAEELNNKNQFDIVVARALAPLADFVGD
jgi:16S rRNA G527 N7-methylase RsmG